MRCGAFLLLLLLVLGLACLAQQSSALRAESAALKRNKKKKKVEQQRQLDQTQQKQQEDHVAKALQGYLSNAELTERLQDFEKRCKHIASLSKIGSSVEGRPLWALEISDKPGQQEAEPAVKYVGNVHGDEPTGRVLTLALAEWLCAHHKSDPRAKRIVQTVHLWLVPSMNPDGFEAKTRGNKAERDLNRDFPDRFASSGMQRSGQEQPETAAIMDWTMGAAGPFVASASMHEGALVANYPWDGTPDQSTQYEASPDDDTFKHLAQLYATTHRLMSSPDNPEFPGGGITNGAAWYPIYGSMQDWNYIAAGCMELTLELSPGKWPAEDTLAQLWEDNRDALLAFPLAAAYGGVWGSVREEGKLRSSKGQELAPLGGANITVIGLDRGVVSREGAGDFYRPLAPGRYTLVVSKEGFKPFSVNLTVPADGSGAQRHFVLAPEGSSSSGEVAYSLRNLAHPPDSSTEGSEGDGSSGGGLPWNEGGGGSALSGAALSLQAATRAKDRVLMMSLGALVVYGLWVTHSRLQRRTGHQRKA